MSLGPLPKPVEGLGIGDAGIRLDRHAGQDLFHGDLDSVRDWDQLVSSRRRFLLVGRDGGIEG